MAQQVQPEQFTLAELQTEAGVQRLNLWIKNVAEQIWIMNGNAGAVKPDNNIDLQNKYKIVNEAK